MTTVAEGLDEFRTALARDRVVPVTRRLLADAETPVGAYRKLAGGRPGTFRERIRAVGHIARTDQVGLIVAMILFAILAYPIYWQHQVVPGGLFGVIQAAALVLLLLPFTVIYELILRASRDALVLLARRYRAEDAVTVHSLVKNAAYALISEVDSDSGAGAETRSLAREMLALTEEARLLFLGRAADLGGVELLWHCVTRVLPSGGQITAELDPASHTVQLSGTDYQLARRCLVDLMTNAWKAGAHRIEVAVRVAEQPGAARSQTVLRVDDDGPGMPPGVLDNPATSLAVMAEHLRGYSGSLTFSDRAGGGTRACVRWQSAW